MHVITGLDVGGAEVTLARLVTGLDRDAFAPQVASLSDPGPVAQAIRSAGVAVRSLGMRPRTPPLAAVVRLRRLLRQQRIQVVQTWMYHADLVGGLAARAAGVPVVWGLHQTDLRKGAISRSTRAVAALNARLSSRVPTRIVSCSESGQRAHVAQGYPEDRMTVIPNGFEISPVGNGARNRIRAELGLPGGTVLVTRVGRYHAQKDYPGMVRAAGLVASAYPNVAFALVGQHVTWDNRELADAVRAAGIGDRVRLLGVRDDVRDLLEATDIAVSSSSFGEAFPLVVGEAMERGVPVVVTDVGDSALLAGPENTVVPPADPEALAAGIRALATLDEGARRARGAAGRRRIIERFSIAEMVHRYSEVHLRLAS